MQLYEIPKSFILSTKKWIKGFPEKNQVNSREKSGHFTFLPSFPPSFLHSLPPSLPSSLPLNLSHSSRLSLYSSIYLNIHLLLSFSRPSISPSPIPSLDGPDRRPPALFAWTYQFHSALATQKIRRPARSSGCTSSAVDNAARRTCRRRLGVRAVRRGSIRQHVR